MNSTVLSNHIDQTVEQLNSLPHKTILGAESLILSSQQFGRSLRTLIDPRQITELEDYLFRGAWQERLAARNILVGLGEKTSSLTFSALLSKKPTHRTEGLLLAQELLTSGNLSERERIELTGHLHQMVTSTKPQEVLGASAVLALTGEWFQPNLSAIGSWFTEEASLSDKATALSVLAPLPQFRPMVIPALRDILIVANEGAGANDQNWLEKIHLQIKAVHGASALALSNTGANDEITEIVLATLKGDSPIEVRGAIVRKAQDFGPIMEDLFRIGLSSDSLDLRRETLVAIGLVGPNAVNLLSEVRRAKGEKALKVFASLAEESIASWKDSSDR